VIVSVNFIPKDLLGWFDVSDIFSDTGSNQMVLEPSIGSFHLSFRLRRQGITDLHIAILQDLFPLRGGFIGQQMVVSPDRISPLDKSKDRVRIDIIGVRKSIPKDDSLQGQNMGPAGLCLD
jgi:hypothetical protein